MMKKQILTGILCIGIAGTLALSACGRAEEVAEPSEMQESGQTSGTSSEEIQSSPAEMRPEPVPEELSAEPETESEADDVDAGEAAEPDMEANVVESFSCIAWDPSWEYADYARIHEDSVTLYRADAVERRGIVVAVNAGHGTKGGEQVKTQCHPDGSAKVVSGSTSAGATEAVAVSSGMTFADGTPEAEATLSLANLLKDELLMSGYDVLMIREDEDVQLDNIARTVFANQNADCHIALHYDSTDSDKGVFYIGVPDAGGYRSMEPVASHWQAHEALGKALISGMEETGIRVFGDGRMAIDLTQTSYSTVPSADLEVGDRVSDHSRETQQEIAEAIVRGLDAFYQEND